MTLHPLGHGLRLVADLVVVHDEEARQVAGLLQRAAAGPVGLGELREGVVVEALGLSWDPAVLGRFEKVPMPVNVRPGEWRGYATKQAGDTGGGNAPRTMH